MRKKRFFIILIPCILLFVLVMSILAFYALAYSKFDTLIFAANNVADPQFDEPTFISEENYKKLVLVPQELLKDENTYREVRKKFHFSILEINRVKFVTTFVVTADPNHAEGKTQQFRATVEITMVFSDFMWKVTEVSEV